MRKAIIIILLIAGCTRPVSRPILIAEGVKAVQVDIMKLKQHQWQRMKKLQASYHTYDYWLSTDPNMCAGDLNFDGLNNFYDYAILMSRDATRE